MEVHLPDEHRDFVKYLLFIPLLHSEGDEEQILPWVYVFATMYLPLTLTEDFRNEIFWWKNK